MMITFKNCQAHNANYSDYSEILSESEKKRTLMIMTAIAIVWFITITLKIGNSISASTFIAFIITQRGNSAEFQ